MAWALFITLALNALINTYGAARLQSTGDRFFGFCIAFWMATLAAWVWFAAPIWGPA